MAIQKGEKIEPGMVAFRRPRSEIAADEIDPVPGCQARIDIPMEQSHKWEQLERED